MRAARIAIVLLLSLSPAARAATKPSLAQVTQGLSCQCGGGLTVANCNHPSCSFSVPLRTEVQSMIDRGDSATFILASYRARYGEKILSAPTTEGFNLLAWTMPFLALALGIGGIAFVFSRWRSRVAAEPIVEDRARNRFTDEMHQRLDREVRDQA